MSLIFSTVGIKEQQPLLQVFSHGDAKEANLALDQKSIIKTEDWRNLASFSFDSENEAEDEKQGPEESSESSTIGAQSSSSSSEEDAEGNEAQSKLKEEVAPSFVSLDSLEDSLPIKRGLSNFFTGKSKSFASLSDAAAGSARELAKQENPFNKRRRVLMANKISSWGRRASYSSLITSLPSLLSPDLVLKEGEEEEDERGEEDSFITPLPKPLSLGAEAGLRKSFKSPRSFSLSDLQSA